MRSLGAVFLIAIAALVISCAPRYPVMVRGEGLEPDPRLVHGTLDNGFQYLLMKNNTPKDRVVVHLNIFAGSINESDEEQGVAHYLEHLLFNGSEHFKPGELVEYFQSIGMDFGGDANARTSFFNTVYDLNLPKGTKEYLDKGLLVIQDYAKGALLLETEVERERGIILSEMRDRDSVSYRMFKDALAFELPDSLLTRRFPIGKKQVIETADRALIKSFYDKWYRPDNMVLVMVGDFDLGTTQEIIKQRFSDFKPRKMNLSKPIDISWREHKGTKVFYDHEPEAGYTSVTIERLGHVPFEVQSLDRLKKDVIDRMADAVVQNRLSSMVRKQTAGFTSASVYSGRYLQNLSVAAISADCEPGNWQLSLTQLQRTLKQMLTYGATPREVDRIKADMISGLESDVQQASTRKSGVLAREILESVNSQEVFLSPEQRLALLRSFIQGVRLDDINGAFQKNWESSHRLILVGGNVSIDGSPKQVILDTYSRALAQSVEPYKGIQAKAFPYLTQPSSKATILGKRENVGELGITQVDFSNYLRLNIKQTDFKAGEFQFKVTFGQGQTSTPVQIPGIGFLAQSTIGNSGLGSMDPDQLSDALAGRDVGIGFSVQPNYFALSGSAAPDELELVYQLIYAYLRDPGFRAQGLELAKIRYQQQFDGLMRTPDGLMEIKGDRFLANGDKRFGLPSPKEVNAITLDQIENWLRPVFNSAPIEVSIVGDFDGEKAISLAQFYLGGLVSKERKKTGAVFSSPRISFPKGKDLDLTVDSRIEKGMVRLVFSTDDFWEIQQTRQLAILAQVLSERLRKIIREDLGAAYSPYVYSNPSLIHKDYGTFHLVVNVKPANGQLVLDAINRIIEDIRKSGITQKEVNLALKPVLSHLKELRRTNNYWLNSVMAGSMQRPERLAWAQHIIEGYKNISPRDLNGLVNRYLNPKSAARIRIYPKN